MKRTITCLAVMMTVCVLAAAGCGRRAAEVADYKDAIPLPAEPRVTQVAAVGRYGGRFVIGQTGNPKTFNAPMANETSSTDITLLIFTVLVDFDNASQQFIPGLA